MRLSQSKLAYYQSKVKMLNQRIAELEKQNKQGLSNWYSHLKKDMFDGKSIMTKTQRATYEETRTKDGAKRYVNTGKKHNSFKFRTDISKMNHYELRSLQRAIDIAENKSKTSTIRGIKNTYIKGFETYKAQHTGVDISIDTYKQLYDNAKFESAIKKYGYSDTINMINSRNDDDINTILNDILNSKSLSDFYTLNKEQLNDLEQKTGGFQEVDEQYIKQYLGF